MTTSLTKPHAGNEESLKKQTISSNHTDLQIPGRHYAYKLVYNWPFFEGAVKEANHTPLLSSVSLDMSLGLLLWVMLEM